MYFSRLLRTGLRREFKACFVDAFTSHPIGRPQRVMHSILCTRVLFLILRQQKMKGPDAKPPPEFSSIFTTLTNEKDTINEINMHELS